VARVARGAQDDDGSGRRPVCNTLAQAGHPVAPRDRQNAPVPAATGTSKIMRRSPVTLRLPGLAGLLLSLLCMSASANEYGANLTIRSAPGGDQFCMDAKGDRQGDGTPVFLWRCHGRENQRWTVTHNADGTSIVTGTGGLCLDVRGNGSRDGTPVHLWQCHFGGNQRFRFFDDGRIQEVGTGKCLMVLPQWAGERDREHERDEEFQRKRAWERWHARDFDHLRLVEQDGAAIVIDDCEPRALQFWHLRR
jgi:Ricin-type beta-trefoil lectin domain